MFAAVPMFYTRPQRIVSQIQGEQILQELVGKSGPQPLWIYQSIESGNFPCPALQVP